MSQALQVFAGPRARRQLAERGLRPEDVRIIPAAAGGPKGLILNRLDQFIFGDWLWHSSQPVHLLGGSIGAWRMASAAVSETPAQAVQEFERFAQAYVNQHYESEPGRMPRPESVSRTFQATLQGIFGGREACMLGTARWRLHVSTSRGRGLLSRDGRWRTPLGYAAAFAANAIGRRHLGGLLERVVFSDPRSTLPVPLDDFPSHEVMLTEANVLPAILASCSIPFWLQAVRGIPGAPHGAYWDGGITDYHLHLPYARMAGDGLVLYPHFQPQIIPGWMDKALKHRHRASAALDNVVVLSPHPDWVRGLPGGKLPDRRDFTHFGNDVAARARVWRQAIAESGRLADELATLVLRSTILAEPL